jgi:hypothetical protein
VGDDGLFGEAGGFRFAQGMALLRGNRSLDKLGMTEMKLEVPRQAQDDEVFLICFLQGELRLFSGG